MIDLPDHGYTLVTVSQIDPGGALEGTLGGPFDYIDRPGIRYSASYQTRNLRSSDDARKFQALLEQGVREDVSYPWPLDFRAPTSGTPRVNGASPTGSVIPLKGLLPNYPFRLGQPLAVLSGGVGFIHRAAEATVADATGAVVLPVFPWTRVAFGDNDPVEVEYPRIRGILSWTPPDQGAASVRSFRFSITERL